MKFTTIVTLGMAHLGSLTIANPLRLRHSVDVLSYLPDKVIWHETKPIPINYTLSSASVPVIGGDVTACSSPSYDKVSTARTSIFRDDCLDLAEQVKATPGFWELCKWSHGHGGEFKPLISNGTCEFAVKRRFRPGDFNSSNSEVVIIGNHDVYKILNASVHDFAASADEPFVDAERNQGHMNCKWWFAANASMEFRIQKTGQK